VATRAGALLGHHPGTFHIPRVCEAALEPFINPVSGEVRDIRVDMPKGVIFQTAQAARLEFAGP
jgi:hypothetical protein